MDISERSFCFDGGLPAARPAPRPDTRRFADISIPDRLRRAAHIVAKDEVHRLKADSSEALAYIQAALARCGVRSTRSAEGIAAAFGIESDSVELLIDGYGGLPTFDNSNLFDRLQSLAIQHERKGRPKHRN